MLKNKKTQQKVLTTKELDLILLESLKKRVTFIKNKDINYDKEKERMRVLKILQGNVISLQKEINENYKK